MEGDLGENGDRYVDRNFAHDACLASHPFHPVEAARIGRAHRWSLGPLLQSRYNMRSASRLLNLLRTALSRVRRV